MRRKFFDIFTPKNLKANHSVAQWPGQPQQFFCFLTAFCLALGGVSGWWVGADLNGLPINFLCYKRYFLNFFSNAAWPAPSTAKFLSISKPF